MIGGLRKVRAPVTASIGRGAGPAGTLKPRALLVGAAVVLVWAGVPAVAGYALLRHSAVWDAMDAQPR